jgi:hypothetical protein
VDGRPTSAINRAAANNILEGRAKIMATAVAAIMAKARREVEDVFHDKKAFSPDHAMAFEPRDHVQSRFLDQLIAEGVVREAGPGRYWMDLDAFERMRRKRLISVLWIMGLFLVVLIGVGIAKQIG